METEFKFTAGDFWGTGTEEVIIKKNLVVDFKGEMDETLLMGNYKRAVGGVGDRRANY